MSCEVKCSNVEGLLQFSVTRVAQALQEHADLVERLREQLNLYMALREGDREEALGQLSEYLVSLRNVRDGIEKAVDEYSMIASCCLARSQDFEALLGYYIMAGSRRERETLEQASRFIDVRGDFERLERLVRALQDALITVSSSAGNFRD
ncbi:MAG: hypothetical protein RXN88_03930 [Acidilobus sp.]